MKGLDLLRGQEEHKWGMAGPSGSLEERRKHTDRPRG